MAALLKIENIKTHIIDLEYKSRPESQAYKLCIDLGIMIERFNINKIPSSDWYVDGVFGIGLNRDLQGNYLRAINYLQCSQSKKILSLDLPSGLDGSKSNYYISYIEAGAFY